MARGNQRDIARAKNLKKQQEGSKQKKGDPKKRMESDADVMRKKQQEGE
jgi:4F5 protein family.